MSFLTRTTNFNPSIAHTLAGDFSDEEMQTLSSLGTVINITAGETFASEGTVGREAVVVLSGTADVVRGTEVIATVGHGSVLGEVALLTGERRNASLVAHTDMTISVLNPREFSSLLAQQPRLAAEIEKTAAARSAA